MDTMEYLGSARYRLYVRGPAGSSQIMHSLESEKIYNVGIVSDSYPGGKSITVAGGSRGPRG
jgi:hypothetical protein